MDTADCTPVCFRMYSMRGDGPVCLWNLYPGVVDCVHQRLSGFHEGAASRSGKKHEAPVFMHFLGGR